MKTRLRFNFLTPLVLTVLALLTLSETFVSAVPISGATTLVSKAPDGTPDNAGSLQASVTADGRFVAFASWASNLIPQDENSTKDIFLHDRLSGENTLVSVSSTETQGDDQSYAPDVSSNGRYITFFSAATNLVANDTNDGFDVFVRDRTLQSTQRVSVASYSTQANDWSYDPVISRDGRYIAFTSTATNLIAGDTNNRDDVFLRDLSTFTTTRVSVSSDETQGNGESTHPSISDDGRYIVFASRASSLVSGDSNGLTDIFVRDTALGTTARLSVASIGTQANGGSSNAYISRDGRHVVFMSDASNLIPDDTNGVTDTFVHELATGTTTRVSVASDGTQANGASLFKTAISDDGRYVTFQSSATNLVSGDTNDRDDIFWVDIETGFVERVSVASDGTQADGSSQSPDISGDGQVVVFTSYAKNLVPEDSDFREDVYAHDIGPDIQSPEIDINVTTIEETHEQGQTSSTTTFLIGNGSVSNATLHWTIAEDNGPTTAPNLASPDVILEIPTLPLVAAQTVPPNGVLQHQYDAFALSDPLFLALDDGSAENTIGLAGGGEFLWLNRFTPSPMSYPFVLTQVQLYMAPESQCAAGSTIDIYVYTDSDGNPANGAQLVGSLTGQTTGAPGQNNRYATNFLLTQPGDALIGVVNRGCDADGTFVASLDQSSTYQRSWIGSYSGNPPNPPTLPPPAFNIIDNYDLPGNWMIRALGTSLGSCPSAENIPWLIVSPTSGATAAGSTSTITVEFNSEGLADGVYSASLCVASDDPDQPTLVLPVSLTVRNATLSPTVSPTPIEQAQLFLPLVGRE